MDAYIVDDGRNSAFRLVGDSGKGVQGALAADAAEYHYGGGSKLVYNDFRLVRHHGLGAVVWQHVKAPAVKDLLDHFHLAGMQGVAGAARKVFQDGLGNVVLCWSKASGCDHYIAL